MDTLEVWKRAKKHFLSECEMVDGTMVVDETGKELTFSKEYGEKSCLGLYLRWNKTTKEEFIIFETEGKERGTSQWITEATDFPKALEKAFREYGYAHRKACQMRLF